MTFFQCYLQLWLLVSLCSVDCISIEFLIQLSVKCQFWVTLKLSSDCAGKFQKKKSCFYLMAQENIISNEQIYKWMIYIVRAAVAIFANPRTYIIIKIKTTFQLPVYCKVPIASWECWVYVRHMAPPMSEHVHVFFSTSSFNAFPIY